MSKRIQPKRSRTIYLLEWRKHRHLTQGELAHLMHTTDESVSRWEGGRRNISVNVLIAAANALHITPQDLFRHPDTVSLDALLRDVPRDMVEAAANQLKSFLKKNGQI